jgi:hypothetical protein
MEDRDLKEIGELSAADLLEFAIWEFVGEHGPGDGKVRARPDLTVHDPSVGTGDFAVRTGFTLADGSQFTGYSSPIGFDVPQEQRLGYLAPALITKHGQVRFWLGAVEQRPNDRDLNRYYKALERQPEATFPVRFKVDVPVQPDETASGVIHGFGGMIYRDRTFIPFEMQ